MVTSISGLMTLNVVQLADVAPNGLQHVIKRAISQQYKYFGKCSGHVFSPLGRERMIQLVNLLLINLLTAAPLLPLNLMLIRKIPLIFPQRNLLQQILILITITNHDDMLLLFVLLTFYLPFNSFKKYVLLGTYLPIHSF